MLLAEEKFSGLIHVVGPEVIDRVSFARAIASAFGFDPSRIESRPTADLGQGATPVERRIVDHAARRLAARPHATARRRPWLTFGISSTTRKLRDWVKPDLTSRIRG